MTSDPILERARRLRSAAARLNSDARDLLNAAERLEREVEESDPGRLRARAASLLRSAERAEERASRELDDSLLYVPERVVDFAEVASRVAERRFRARGWRRRAASLEKRAAALESIQLKSTPGAAEELPDDRKGE